MENDLILNLFTLFHQHTSLEILVFKNESFLSQKKKKEVSSVPIPVAKDGSPIQISLIRTNRTASGHVTKRPSRMLPSGMAGFRISCIEDAVSPSLPVGSASVCTQSVSGLNGSYP